MEKCLFCKWKNENERKILENNLAFACYDEIAVNPGHMLFMTKRHVETFFDTTLEERIAIFELIDKAKILIDEKYHPDGYNIGMNCKEAGGDSKKRKCRRHLPRRNRKGQRPDQIRARHQGSRA